MKKKFIKNTCKKVIKQYNTGEVQRGTEREALCLFSFPGIKF